MPTAVSSVDAALRRRLTLVALVVLFALLGVLVPAAPALADPTASLELQLGQLINDERARVGAPPLQVDVRLTGGARAWSRVLSGTGQLAHDPNLERALPAGVRSWSENVGQTTSSNPVAALHGAFMDSPRHRTNLLDADFTEVGVGIAQGANGTFVTERFSAGAPAYVAPAVDATAGTATAVFGPGGASHAVVVRDDAFPDALAAGPLAGAQGPVLLSPPGPVLHPAVRDSLEQVLPRGHTVYLVGGSMAVSEGVEEELRGAGWDVRRLAGSDRVTTAAAVAREMAARQGPPAEVLLATSGDWPDAASGGAYGAWVGAPVLLAYPDGLPDATEDVLDELEPDRVLALGGERALDDTVVEAAGAERVSGATREATAVAVAEDLWWRRAASDAPRWILVPSNGGDAWTWALGAAPLAARFDSTVLLVDDPVSGAVTDYLEELDYGDATAELWPYGPVNQNAVGVIEGLVR